MFGVIYCRLSVPQARYFEKCYYYHVKTKRMILLCGRYLQVKSQLVNIMLIVNLSNRQIVIYCANKNNIDDLMHIFFECGQIKATL